MVQFIKGSADPRDAALGQLASALGYNIGNRVNLHYANEALQGVLNDESLKSAPISAKMGKLQSALYKYGDVGKELLQNTLQIEQQAYNERLAKEQQTASREKENRLFAHQKELQGLKNQGKLPPGGITAQPVPTEINQKISQVLANSKGLSADELKLQMDQQGIPPIYSNGYIESRRVETKPTFEPESEKLEAKRVSEFATQIEKDYLTAKNENFRLNRMQELSDKGEVSTPLLIKALDTIGLPIGILSNPDTEEYRKLETDFIREARDIFPGGRITNYEIQSYLKTIPSLLNSKEGRESIIRNRKLLNEAKEVKYNEYKNILKENGGKKPPNLGIILEERISDKISNIEDRFKQGIQKEIEKFQQPVRMLDPQGRPVNIPPNQIEKALKAGAKFA